MWSAPSTDGPRRWLAALALASALVLAAGAEAANARSWSSLDELATRASFPRNDFKPPTVPSGLALTSVTATAVSLSWQPSRDNRRLRGYAVYRDGALVATTSRASTTFRGLACGRTYTLGVAAFDAAGNRSEQASLGASTSPCPDTLAPTQPANVTQTGATRTSISLFWSPSLDDVGVAGYGLYRGGVRIGTAAVTNFVVGGLACGTSYPLGLDSYDSAGNRSAITSVFASTSACPVATTVTTSPLPQSAAPTPPAAPPPAPVPTLPTPVPTPPTPVPTPPPPASASAKPLGFSNGLAPLTHAERGRLLNEGAAIGVRWNRIDVAWAAIQSSASAQYNWQPYKDYLAAASARGVQVLGTIDHTPAWLCGQEWCAPDPVQYGQFCRDVARNLGPSGLRHVEVWNEPNISVFFKPAPNAAHYAAMLKECYRQVKAVDPGILVVSGGLSPQGGYNDPLCNGGTSNAESANINPTVFTERMYANGAAGHFDALGHHPYEAAGADAVHVCSAWYQMANTSPSLRSLMGANGDGAKAIWNTEWGMDLAWVGNSEAQQANEFRIALDLWKGYAWSGPFFVHHQWQGITNLPPGMALARADWSKRPVWDVLAAH